MPTRPRDTLHSRLVVAAFSRHPDALTWAWEQLQAKFGPIDQLSEPFEFHHTAYYQASMGVGLTKQLAVFTNLVAPDSLPDAKISTIQLEADLSSTRRFSEPRPLNLDPGLLQLGKLLLASTKDQIQRVYLRDNIFAEITLRYVGKSFEPWPWTYADYREPCVIAFLNHARMNFYNHIVKIRREKP
jgi:hypothetical protein